MRRADAWMVRLLHIVRRTCILLRRGNIVVADALLGRFLPRLGPLVVTQAASLCLDGITPPPLAFRDEALPQRSPEMWPL
jgi:hypothetical protein